MLGFILIPETTWQCTWLAPFLYLDPGSGSMIIQMVIAGILGAMFVFRGYLRKFFNKFRNPKEQEKHINDHEDW